MSQHCLLCQAWTSCPKSGDVTPKRFKNSTMANSLLNTLWLTVAATSLNTRSTCEISVIKGHTATQLMIFGVISAGVPHSSLPHTTSPVNEGWNLDDDKINV